MGSAHQVHPALLLTTAAVESSTSLFVSVMASGQSLTRAANSLASLHAGAACSMAADLLDSAADALVDELSRHADALVSAADRYQRADEQLGNLIREPEVMGPS